MPPTDNITVAAIITFGSIITALLGYLGVVATGARRHAKAARHEVQNSHEVNLRDDLDDKFRGLEAAMAGFGDALGEVKKDVGGMRSDIRLIRTEASQDREHVRRFEESIINNKEH